MLDTSPSCSAMPEQKTPAMTSKTTSTTSSLTRIERGDIKILMGDFNAKIGPTNNGLETIKGRHGVGTRSNNGDRLIDLCQTFQLVIGGTVFPHKEIHRYTWTSPNGHTRNQIDHICISRKWRRSIMDVRNRRSASIDSDHELIIGELLIKLRRNSNTVNRTTRRPPPLNVQWLSDSNLSTRMTTTLREQMTSQPENHSWEQTCSVLRISCTEQPSSTQENFSSIVPSNNFIISPTAPSIRKIKDAIRKLKHNKAAGDDGIMAETLHSHFNNIWESERIPTSWKKGTIIKLPKKGDLSDCNNWRGITLLKTSYKVLATLLNERLQKKIEPTLRDEQGGFRPHRSCVDQANTQRAITEQTVEWRSPLYLLFIDFQKA
nr:uncharacterized protein LOC122321444 [Drosophila bipectinata]